MSTNVYRATYRPGEEILRQAAARLAERRRGQREGVDRFVERHLSEYEERFGEAGREVCELAGRVEEVRELAPSDLREETEALFERGTGLGELSERVEVLEREEARRYENRQICDLGTADIARSAGSAIEGSEWKGGELRSMFRFRDGHRMVASMPEGSLGDGVSWEIAWDGRTSDTRDCSVQEDSVRQAIDGSDKISRSDGPPSPERPGGSREAAREREGAGG